MLPRDDSLSTNTTGSYSMNLWLNNESQDDLPAGIELSIPNEEFNYKSLKVRGRLKQGCSFSSLNFVHDLMDASDQQKRDHAWILRFSKDGKYLACGFHSGALKVWQTKQQSRSNSMASTFKDNNPLAHLFVDPTMQSGSESILTAMNDRQSKSRSFLSSHDHINEKSNVAKCNTAQL
jgi:hypothetical protein